MDTFLLFVQSHLIVASLIRVKRGPSWSVGGLDLNTHQIIICLKIGA